MGVLGKAGAKGPSPPTAVPLGLWTSSEPVVSMRSNGVTPERLLLPLRMGTNNSCRDRELPSQHSPGDFGPQDRAGFCPQASTIGVLQVPIRLCARLQERQMRRTSLPAARLLDADDAPN